MNCVINQSILDSLRRGRSLESTKQYLKERYRISIEEKALQRRVKQMQPTFSS